jgi:acetyl esterase/lipase
MSRKHHHLYLAEKRTIRAGDHRIRIRIIRPAGEPPEKSPGVLWIHGGGYQSGSSRDVYVTRALSLAVKFGAVVVSPDYRLSRKHPYPAGLHDCYAALLYMKKHAEELGIRPDQLMAGGESAGGGLTAALCMLARDRGRVNIAYQMPLYPMLDCRDTPSSEHNTEKVWNTSRNHLAWKLYLRSLEGREDIPCYASPARCTDYSGLPPAYTFVGDIEPFYCETVDYIENLRAAGVPAEIDVYKGFYHAYDMFENDAPDAREAARVFLEHFRYAQQNYFAPQPEEP